MSARESERELFFWERDRASMGRTRFNLLLLEYGEFFFEDKGAYMIPILTDGSDRSLELSDAMKVQGRIKICSRSIIFEPADVKKPLLKVPFKSLTAPVQPFSVTHSKKFVSLIDTSGYFTLRCTSYFEIKANNKIGPYKFVEFPDSNPETIVFSLIHSDLDDFLRKVDELRMIFTAGDKKGFISASAGLSSIAADRSLVQAFDSSLLLDFHETLLLRLPVAVRKVSPLQLNPGGLMVTSARIYFQPAQLNNVGDKVLHFEIRSISRLYRRRYLLLDTGVNISAITKSR